MKPRKYSSAVAALAVSFGAISAILLLQPSSTSAQGTGDPSADHSKHAQKTADPAGHKPLPEQIADLREKVARLEAALDKTSTKSGAAMGGQGMGMGMDRMMGGMSGAKKGAGGMSGMGMMDDMMGGMGAGQSQGMGGMANGGQSMSAMSDDMDMMGMMGMGSMGGGSKGMGKMKMAAALPGFPGASHIYHIGSTGFFLDHPEHITLSTQQQTRLNRVKQKALTDKSSAQRKIDEAEQELWELTASDEPDGAKIEGQVRAIEKLRGDQRFAVIRAVGEAAKVLTDEQRQTLLGTGSADPHKQHAAPVK